MGVRVMSGELHELSVAIGRLEATVEILAKTVEDNQASSTEEHRKVHDIVVATSEAVRNLAAKIAVMEQLTDDYREKRAEWRGAARLVHIVYVVGGGLVGAVLAKAMEFFSIKPHP